MRVVIADDSEPLRRVVAETVITLGGEIVGEAGDGYAAVVAAVALDPDVVIMDWQMPDLDGVAATEAIRQHRPAVEVIAYSAADDSTVAERFRRAGASAYIDKADTAGLFAELKRRLTPVPDRRLRSTPDRSHHPRVAGDWLKQVREGAAGWPPPPCGRDRMAGMPGSAQTVGTRNRSARAARHGRR